MVWRIIAVLDMIICIEQHMRKYSMDYRKFYETSVYPHLELHKIEKYPLVKLGTMMGYKPLSDCTVVMLVALTGTGKTTTLDALMEFAANDIEQGMSVIPTRREIADWVTIPNAQLMLDEKIVPVTDRVKRFHYTRTFAERVTGGMATAFSWVSIQKDFDDVIISEGIRGANEITHALENFPNWHIVELALNPITRLKRLSGRSGNFDKAEGVGDTSFLPEELQAEVQSLLESGEITPKALMITQAESQNYGLYPFVDGHKYENYHRVDADDQTPELVARSVYAILKDIIDADN
jgi:hypothetical protein